ncbi:rod shape-determining protein MreC [Caminibacter mediatlanticus]|uniref:rod shape-determining protein MreC n=1 Tax=Caminibacter mediatlanticus TaxID=291048 RepID=UPI0002DDC504|nr:rod shape-determining protein MreC [Caminibacter mediatlanticus]
MLIFLQIPVVKTKIVDIANNIKIELSTFKTFIKEKINYFSNQQQLINDLKKENIKLKKEVAILNQFIEPCKDLKGFKIINDSNLTFVKTISYAALPDFTQIYINYNKPISIPRGLVYNNVAAGIVVKNFGNYSLGLLNSNKRVTYTVIIGNREIPGIFKGGSFKVEYIKKFLPIKIGDIVKTSGLDGVFYKGALVGKVIKINQKKLYQEAIIKPFYNKLTPDYFYVVEKNDTIKKIGGKNGLNTN